LPRTFQFALPGLLRRLLLLRPEGLPGSQGVLLPSINELRPLTPPRLLEYPVANPFALGSDCRQLCHESSHRQGELYLALSNKVIRDSVPAAHDVKAGLRQLSLPG